MPFSGGGCVIYIYNIYSTRTRCAVSPLRSTARSPRRAVRRPRGQKTKKEKSNMKWEIYIPGEPVAQGRARSRLVMSKKTGKAFITHYDPTKSRSHKSTIIDMAMEVAPEVPTTRPLNFCLKIYRSIPSSKGPAFVLAAENGLIRPTSRPDLSNYLKGAEDALLGIIYRDDSQIVSYDGSGQWYSRTPGTLVTITELPCYASQDKISRKLLETLT